MTDPNKRFTYIISDGPLTLNNARADFLALAELWADAPLDVDLMDRLQDAMEDLWSVAKKQNGRCPTCNGETALVIAPAWWTFSIVDGEAHVHEEITGHWCSACERLVSLSLHTDD